jgi:hypothetical protein
MAYLTVEPLRRIGGEDRLSCSRPADKGGYVYHESPFGEHSCRCPPDLREARRPRLGCGMSLAGEIRPTIWASR